MSAATSLSGPCKAALVILALDEDVATEVLRLLDESDLKRLALSADRLDPIPADAIGPTFEELLKRMNEPSLPRGAGAYLRKLAAGSIGDDRARRLFAPVPATQPPLDAIRTARTATLAELLAEEHPQVAAVILSQLPRAQAASVLLAIPADRQVDLLKRIAALSEVPQKMIELASEALAKTLAAAGGIGGGAPEFDGLGFTAGILNELPPADSDRLLGAIDQVDQRLGPKIREAMFTFEDLGRLEVRALQVLMREVATDQLLMALKTASEELRERFLGAVSSRAAATMREDLAAMAPTRLSEVEKSQREIVECAMRLASEGRMVMPGRSGEKLV